MAIRVHTRHGMKGGGGPVVHWAPNYTAAINTVCCEVFFLSCHSMSMSCMREAWRTPPCNSGEGMVLLLATPSLARQSARILCILRLLGSNGAAGVKKAVTKHSACLLLRPLLLTAGGPRWNTQKVDWNSGGRPGSCTASMS